MDPVPSFGSPVKARDIVIFTRQFATMIDAGLPIVQCLQILAAQTDSKPFRRVISNIKDDVESGTTMAEAIKKQGKVFSELYMSMVQAGEIGGILDTILVRLANYLEKAAKLRSKIKGAMIYPACIVTAAVVVTAVLLIWVIRSSPTCSRASARPCPRRPSSSSTSPTSRSTTSGTWPRSP
jgi:type IV pilus assembly protein PilC